MLSSDFKKLSKPLPRVSNPLSQAHVTVKIRFCVLMTKGLILMGVAIFACDTRILASQEVLKKFL